MKDGHTLKECTEKKGDANDGICYNCGSNEHRLDYCTQERSRELPFANCFVCGEVGHVSFFMLIKALKKLPQKSKWNLLQRRWMLFLWM